MDVAIRRDGPPPDPQLASWIGWWSLGTVAMRVLIVWLYNNTGKTVFAAALLHAMGNVCWQLFPVHGSYFDPRTNGIATVLAAFAVTVVWGPHKLVRQRTRRP